VDQSIEQTAAVSTPVGPPPQMTKLKRRFLSSGDVVGRLASSKLSERTLASVKEKKLDKNTQNAASDSLCVANGFKLEAVL